MPKPFWILLSGEMRFPRRLSFASHEASAPVALILSPHPDDECIVVSLIRLLREAIKIVNVAITLGSKVERDGEARGIAQGMSGSARAPANREQGLKVTLPTGWKNWTPGYKRLVNFRNFENGI